MQVLIWSFCHLTLDNDENVSSNERVHFYLKYIGLWKYVGILLILLLLLLLLSLLLSYYDENIDYEPCYLGIASFIIWKKVFIYIYIYIYIYIFHIHIFLFEDTYLLGQIIRSHFGSSFIKQKILPKWLWNVCTNKYNEYVFSNKDISSNTYDTYD